MPRYVYFYHYTSEEGKKAIKKCGYIRANPAGGSHAHFGPGVYGTSMEPWEGKTEIAENNWTPRHALNYVFSGSCDWAFEIRIPAAKVKQVGPGGRDILLYKHDLYLEDFRWSVVEVDDD